MARPPNAAAAASAGDRFPRLMAGRKASSCADCLAWGVLNGRCCSSCSVWRHKHPDEAWCAGCGRILAVKDGYCRLCWQQARYQSRIAGGLPRGAVPVLQDGDHLHWHQLFFDRMQVRCPHSPVRQHDRRGAPAKPPAAPAGRPAFCWVQARLFEAWRDFTRFDEDTEADPGNPWLAWGLYLAWQRGESRGWRRGLRFAVRRALIIVLSRHQPGDAVRYSEIIPLQQQALGVRAGRTAEVLQEMGVLDDDRRLSFEDWLERKLDGLAPGIRADTEVAADHARRRPPQQAPRHLLRLEPHALHPAGAAGMVISVRPPARGHPRRRPRRARGDARIPPVQRAGSAALAVRVLQEAEDDLPQPAPGIPVGERTRGIIQPLSQDEVDQAAGVAVTPDARLLLVLAAMHAARVKAIREIRLDDVDLGNRRIVIGGRARPLDDLTRQVLLKWLARPARPLALYSQPAPDGQPTERQRNRPGQQELFRHDSAAREGRHPGKAPRRPAAPGGPRLRTRSAAPGINVRPRPQDRDPLRGQRPAAAHHGRRRARSRRPRRRLMTASSLQAALRAGADGLYALEAGTGLIIAHGSWPAREDFGRFIHVGSSITVPGTELPSIDWEAAITALDAGGFPSSSGEKKMLRLAASLARDIPVRLGNAVTGIDGRNVGLLVKVLHASGQRQFPR